MASLPNERNALHLTTLPHLHISVLEFQKQINFELPRTLSWVYSMRRQQFLWHEHFQKKQSSFAVESISLKGFCLNKISVMKMCSVTWNRFPINFWWLIQLCRLCGDYLNTDIYESLKLNHREDMKAEPVGWFLESLQKT